MNRTEHSEDAYVVGLLASALDAEDRQTAAPDLHGMVRQAREQARRHRRRTTLWVGAAAATVAVVGGAASLATLSPGSSGDRVSIVPAGAPTSAPATAPATTPGAGVAVPPAFPATETAVPPGLVVHVPRNAFLRPSDLSFTPDRNLTSDLGEQDPAGAARLRSNSTSLCHQDAEPGDATVVGGRQVMWGTDHNGPTGVDRDVEQVIRVHSGRGAEEQMAFLHKAAHTCAFDLGPWHEGSEVGLPGQDAVVGFRGEGRHVAAWAVVRLDQATVGVYVRRPGKDLAAAEREARRLVVLAVQRVRASGMVTTAPAAPTAPTPIASAAAGR